MRIVQNKRKRTDLDIIYEILNALKNGPLPKTRLIYKANLAYVISQKYIPYLEELGAIKKDNDLYYITSKGMEIHQLLETYRSKVKEIKQILDSLKERIDDKDN